MRLALLILLGSLAGCVIDGDADSSPPPPRPTLYAIAGELAPAVPLPGFEAPDAAASVTLRALWESSDLGSATPGPVLAPVTLEAEPARYSSDFFPMPGGWFPVAGVLVDDATPGADELVPTISDKFLQPGARVEQAGYLLASSTLASWQASLPPDAPDLLETGFILARFVEHEGGAPLADVDPGLKEGTGYVVSADGLALDQTLDRTTASGLLVVLDNPDDDAVLDLAPQHPTHELDELLAVKQIPGLVYIETWRPTR